MRLVILPILDVPVKYKKVDPATIVPRPVIQTKTGDGNPIQQMRLIGEKRYLKDGVPLTAKVQLTDAEGKEVPLSEAIEILERYEYKYLDDKGREVEKKDIHYYATTQDGEQEVSPFDMTGEINIPSENWFQQRVSETS